MTYRDDLAAALARAEAAERELAALKAVVIAAGAAAKPAAKPAWHLWAVLVAVFLRGGHGRGGQRAKYAAALYFDRRRLACDSRDILAISK